MANSPSQESMRPVFSAYLGLSVLNPKLWGPDTRGSENGLYYPGPNTPGAKLGTRTMTRRVTFELRSRHFKYLYNGAFILQSEWFLIAKPLRKGYPCKRTDLLAVWIALGQEQLAGLGSKVSSRV